MPSITTLFTRISENLEDSSNRFYTQATILKSIQDAYYLLSAYADSKVKSATLVWPANTTYLNLESRLSNFLKILGVYYPAQRRFLAPRSVELLDKLATRWEVTVGFPYVFVMLDHRYMGVYQQPSSDVTFTIYYTEVGEHLSDNSNIIVSDEGFRLLENYATGDCLESSIELAKASFWLDSFFGKLELYKESQRDILAASIVNALGESLGKTGLSISTVIPAAQSIIETPLGTMNGSNVTFVLSYEPQANSLALYLNDVLLVLNTDYTLSNGTDITLSTAPNYGEYLRAEYTHL